MVWLFYQTKTREWVSERIGEGVNWDQVNRRLMELTEGAYGKIKRQVDSPWMRGKEEEAIRLRGEISENTRNKRNKKAKKKCRRS